ncbi:MAG: hypothetical protein HY719_11260 [Planctomycetes bacterium]|nr:hypothetical protein [Planctomycetota bacterium]
MPLKNARRAGERFDAAGMAGDDETLPRGDSVATRRLSDRLREFERAQPGAPDPLRRAVLRALENRSGDADDPARVQGAPGAGGYRSGTIRWRAFPRLHATAAAALVLALFGGGLLFTSRIARASPLWSGLVATHQRFYEMHAWCAQRHRATKAAREALSRECVGRVVSHECLEPAGYAIENARDCMLLEQRAYVLVVRGSDGVESSLVVANAEHLQRRGAVGLPPGEKGDRGIVRGYVVRAWQVDDVAFGLVSPCNADQENLDALQRDLTAENRAAWGLFERE